MENAEIGPVLAHAVKGAREHSEFLPVHRPGFFLPEQEICARAPDQP